MMDSRATGDLRKGIAFLRKEVSSELPTQQLAILLEVIAEEGITMPALQKKLYMSSASVSKNIRMLSRFKDGDEIKGYDLLRTEPDLDERRRMAVFPTETGKRIVSEFLDICLGK